MDYSGRSKPIIKSFHLLLSFLIIILPVIALAQVEDGFDDGNFTHDPSWTGDTDEFLINSSNMLQLDAEEEGESYLVTENNMIENTEWQFLIKLSFSPSANNNARVYLSSNENNLEGPLYGYFLQFGESGSDDAIELFKQDGDNIESVCRGEDALISSSFEMRIKVIHKDDGTWSVYADPAGGYNFQPQGTGAENSYTSANYFGIDCKYTKSNKTNMYFDDFYIGPEIIDTIAPSINQIIIHSKKSLNIIFSEAVKKETAENTSNYVLNPGNKNPSKAETSSEDHALVLLTFDTEFLNGTTYTITINNIEDLEGNKAMGEIGSFTYFRPAPFDVVINEIMADPTPPVILPEYEYLELANNTDFTIDLTNWKLITGTSEKKFENAVIPPQGFLIVARTAAESELSGYGEFFGFSSFSLPNSGQSIYLRNNHGQLISSVSYTDDWYKNKDKDDGGWSLEQIDQFNPCGKSDNWAASESTTGGTPGTINSVFKDLNIHPEIERISYISDTCFKLDFTQNMDSLSLLNLQAFEIDKGIGKPDEVNVVDESCDMIFLHFNEPLEKNIIYNLRITDTLFNCSGLPLFPDENIDLGIPEEVSSNDIVINEILFNPLNNGVDYVEIYNRSDKIIDLSGLVIASIDENHPEPPDTNLAQIHSDCYLIFPKEYKVLTDNPSIVKQQYFTSTPEGFVEINSFPSLNNDSGTIFLSFQKEIIDKFKYDQEMHYPLLNSFDGVALERINYNRPADDRSNWHSASESSGFGTPAYENSQFVREAEINDPITIEPEIFTPNSDGVNDVLNIHYEFDKAGYTASITIFDSRGRLVKNLVNNEMLGAKGFFSWDGLTENNEKAPIGIYVILIEVFDTEGKSYKFKKTGVLGNRL